jgi:hypothetical protein
MIPARNTRNVKEAQFEQQECRISAEYAQTADVSSKCILNIVVIDAKLGDCR